MIPSDAQTHPGSTWGTSLWECDWNQLPGVATSNRARTPLRPPHAPHPLFHPPGPPQPQHAAYKRKPEELLAPHPAAAYPEAEGQAVKRQKLGT